MTNKSKRPNWPTFEKPSPELRAAAKKVQAIAASKQGMPRSVWQMPDPLMNAAIMPLMAEENARVDALFRHYGIQRRDGSLIGLASSFEFQRLVVAMASDVFPNFDVFAVSSGPGRKPGRKHSFGDRLIAEVEDVRERRRISVSAACALLSKRAPWNEGEGAAKGSLETRYYEAKRERKEKLLLLNEHWKAMLRAAQEEKRRQEEQAANPDRPTRGLLAQALLGALPNTPEATEKSGE